ncbi:hypothetical protein GF325_08380 [Candidatus Bathyarchaeota archaeon]|nr:hypothetical protein [Candidatus Bathyarchaeota archaeon]
MDGTLPLRKTHVAMLSQSVTLVIGIFDWNMGNDIGFSIFIHLGNKTDPDEPIKDERHTREFHEKVASPESQVVALAGGG